MLDKIKIGEAVLVFAALAGIFGAATTTGYTTTSTVRHTTTTIPKTTSTIKPVNTTASTTSILTNESNSVNAAGDSSSYNNIFVVIAAMCSAALIGGIVGYAIKARELRGHM